MQVNLQNRVKKSLISVSEFVWRDLNILPQQLIFLILAVTVTQCNINQSKNNLLDELFQGLLCNLNGKSSQEGAIKKLL